MGILNDTLMDALQVIQGKFQFACAEAAGGMNISYFADCHWGCGGDCSGDCEATCADDCAGCCVSSCDGASR